MSLHLINIRKKDWRGGLINFIQTFKLLFISIALCAVISLVGFAKAKTITINKSDISFLAIGKSDTTPAKKYTKTATWDLGFIQGKTDSLFLYFRQFGGSAMSKDDFNNALMQYIGVIQRAYLVAKIDSVEIKK